MWNNPYVQVPVYSPMGQQQNPFTQYFGNLMMPMNLKPQPWKIFQVKGKAGADALEIPPSSEVLAMDETDPIIWFIKTDDAGLKDITGLDISIHEDEDKRAMDSLEVRVRKLEEEMKKRHEPDFVDVAFTE